MSILVAFLVLHNTKQVVVIKVYTICGGLIRDQYCIDWAMAIKSKEKWLLNQDNPTGT